MPIEIFMPNPNLSPALVRAMALLLIFFGITLSLWGQQEAQAAFEPLELNKKSSVPKQIRPGKKITLKGFSDNPFVVQGHLLGVLRDSVHLSLDPQTGERAKAHIKDIGSISYISIGWIIGAALLLLYAIGSAMSLVLAALILGPFLLAGTFVAVTIYALIFGFCLYLAAKGAFRHYDLRRWRIRPSC